VSCPVGESACLQEKLALLKAELIVASLIGDLDGSFRPITDADRRIRWSWSVPSRVIQRHSIVVVVQTNGVRYLLAR